MAYELQISWRHLLSRKSQKFISLITFISMGGVALGVMALIVVIAVMSGFGKDLRDKILGTTSHVVVTNAAQGGIVGHARVLQTALTIPGVTAAAPFILKQVMLSYRGRTSGVVLRGIDPEGERHTSDLERNMIDGKISYLEAGLPGERPQGTGAHRRGIILGKELARSLGASPGDAIGMVSPVARMTPLGIIPNMQIVQVVGLFESGMFEYDSGLAFISLQTAQKIFKMRDQVTGIEIKVEDLERAGDIARQLQAKLGFPYLVRDWMQMNKNLFAALKMEKTVMFIILILIILVAAFNIISTLFMVVMDKGKDIAILKALGAPRGSILKIFSLQGLIIGLVGTGAGVLGGFTVVPNINEIVGFLEKVFGFKAFPQDIYYLDRLPSEIQYMDSVLIIVFSIGICFLASLYPAWRASRLDPVEGLRYE
ncbi:MAG: lipoprotein-releasing ABC transporter permease subunit [Nitrospinaceae bacterium]